MNAVSPLRQYRSAEQLTLEALAARFGVNKTTIMRWEEGHVPAERVLAVSKATGIPPHELRPDIYPAPERAA
jgi:DNA-binding transcriptional regulator YdaS (Cro superfamily)